MNISGNGKRKTSIGLTIMGTLILAVSIASVQGQESAPSDESVENGKKVYLSAGCRRCHGLSGQGSTEGPPLVPDPIPLRDFIQYVRSPKGEMPAFSSADLEESDLEDIYTFLKTLTN